MRVVHLNLKNQEWKYEDNERWSMNSELRVDQTRIL